MTQSSVIQSWLGTNRRLIAIGLCCGLVLGILSLAVIKWLPSVFETPLKAEFALSQPERPEGLQEKIGSNEALDLVLAGDYPAGLALVRENALKGYSTAQGVVGSLYYNGLGVPQDYQEAMRWWKLSGDQGDAVGQYMLAIGHATGRGVKKDLTLSRYLTETAAEGGFAPAQFALGTDLLFGSGDGRQRAKGWRWINRAASSGLPAAQQLVRKIQAQIPNEPTARDLMEAYVAEAFRQGVTINEANALAAMLAANRNGQIGIMGPSGLQKVGARSDPLGQAGSSYPDSNETRARFQIDPQTALIAADRFRGTSGATYKYDLGTSYGRMQYDLDPAAQLRDSINVDPRVEIDRSMGLQGGGIEQ